ncbi:HK97 family phage prohead protease [Corynebacterium sp.]|uniref:HK97 family phage prohead protease n=1 Tax=Corynebacterium sp. TaxID=1720 RepID=UPI0028AF5D7C|nr:HK97 family phage prohead protease [Corynebacterium sp.]
MTLHVVIGPPASGKSTFVQDNAAPGIPRWDLDHVANTIAGVDTAYDIPAEVMDVVLAMRRGLMGWLLDVEIPTPELWLIHSAPSPSLIARLSQVGAEFHLIDPGLEECLERAYADGRPQETIDAINAWYEAPPELPGEKGGEVKLKKKSFDIHVKAVEEPSEETGVMVAYAAIFNNVDSYGDVILPGAFANSLKEYEDKERPIPLLYGHDFWDPFSNIGAVTEASEDEKGLKVTAKFDLENPKAAQVFRLVKEKRLAQMSFAYDIVEAAMAERDGEHVYELKEIKLFEVSVVPIGANQETEILEAKSWDSLSPAERQDLAAKAATVITQLSNVLGPSPDINELPSNPPTSKGAPPAEVSSSEDSESADSTKGRANAIEAHLLLLEMEK